MNARRIVTVWGPPVDDYAARIWSGLIGSYYLERWKTIMPAVPKELILIWLPGNVIG